MSKKKPAKPARKTAKKAMTARRPERSKGELSSDDLDSVAGGILMPTALPPTVDADVAPGPTESVSFSYAKVEMTYKPQDSSGKASGDVSMGWPMGKKK